MKKLVIFIILSTLFIIGIQLYGKPLLGLTENTWSVIIGLLGLYFGSGNLTNSKSISNVSNGDNNVSIQNTDSINGNIKINQKKGK